MKTRNIRGLPSYDAHEREWRANSASYQRNLAAGPSSIARAIKRAGASIEGCSARIKMTVAAVDALHQNGGDGASGYV